MIPVFCFYFQIQQCHVDLEQQMVLVESQHSLTGLDLMMVEKCGQHWS